MSIKQPDIDFRDYDLNSVNPSAKDKVAGFMVVFQHLKNGHDKKIFLSDLQILMGDDEWQKAVAEKLKANKKEEAANKL